ncbi:MAG: sulfotransferase [Microcoleaceae cyanobacterium]
MPSLAIDQIENWIFITGVPRSGTTFVGMNLSLPKEVDYIHEPFNPQCGVPGITEWYRYVRPSLDTEMMQHYHQLTQQIFSYNFSLRTNVPANDPWQRRVVKQLIGSRGPWYLRMAKLNPFHQAAIIKDPIGSLMAEYLYTHFKVKPVIVVKHPASFIASIKRVNFRPSPDKLNDQPYLIQDFFADEAEVFARDWSDPVLAAAAFWRIVYKVLLEQASRYPDWRVLTHEQLSQAPVETFKQLYSDVELPWSESIHQKILKQTQGNLSAEARKGRVQDFKRNSADIFKLRRDSLSLQERQSIFEIVKDVALEIYSEDSFALG